MQSTGVHFAQTQKSKMKYLYTLLFFALIALTGNSQSEYYYYADGERMNLNEEKNSLVVHINPSYSEVLGRIELPGLKEKEVHGVYGRAIFHFSEQVDAERINAETLGIPEPDFYSSAHGVRIDDGFFLALTHEVVAQFSQENNLVNKQLDELKNRFGASYSRNEYGTDIFHVNDPYVGLAFANALEESGLVDWAHTDFYGKVSRHNDPFYNQQFQMNNTGQTVNGWAGVADTDCNAPEAWAITLGSSDITVAVIDDGLEPHEDLVTSTGLSRVLGGNTPATGGDGTPRFGSDAHGMACAGIVGATHNNGLGVRGVAPLVNLRSVNIFWGGETSQTIANGINWARAQGVDVMSNSWGYTSCSLSFSNLNTALSNAQNLGRDGKGCIVLFSAGNGGKTCIDYPANRSSVMAIGSVTNRAEHSNYSNEGPQLSLVAPSDASQGQAGASVRTIDRMGSVGYDSGNYTPFFGGTSAACPLVAGSAALVLGYSPELTENQVRSLLENTASDMGSQGFDNTFGNGRINVGAAIASLEPTECETNSLLLTIALDEYPAETTWEITDGSGNAISAGGPYLSSLQFTTVTENICLENGCYTLTFFDSYGDGICCGFGNGNYTLTNESIILISGGEFEDSESSEFCVGEAENPCFNVNFNDYNISSYIPPRDQGTFTIQGDGAGIFLQSNSLKYIPINYDVTTETVIEFEFQSSDQGSIAAIAMEDNTSLTLQRLFKIYGTLNNPNVISDFDTYSGTALQSFSIPIGTYYTGNGLNLVVLSANVNGSPGNNGYFQNIRLFEGTGCTTSGIITQSEEVFDIESSSEFIIQSNQQGLSFEDEFVLFPNPARSNTQLISQHGQHIQTVQVFSITGTLIEQIVVNGPRAALDLRDHANGIYLLKWKDEFGTSHQKKLVKTE